ncbi:hypothetical protein GCM10022226_44170 [Sphaerisporangium flaviroseum]|uniref:Uncharacterized protein n=1 Tax=Sphaerisporangium flaviroseum TaxID=509199 RepID=A0ABP7IHV1_9ACTN
MHQDHARSRGLRRGGREDRPVHREAYMALLMRYSHRAEDARPLYIRLFTLPADEE